MINFPPIPSIPFPLIHMIPSTSFSSSKPRSLFAYVGYVQIVYLICHSLMTSVEEPLSTIGSEFPISVASLRDSALIRYKPRSLFVFPLMAAAPAYLISLLTPITFEANSSFQHSSARQSGLLLCTD